MPSVWALVLVVPAVFVALVDWRKGLFALLFVAFLQDPARKQDLDQPVYFTLLVGVVFAAAYLRAQSPKAFALTQLAGWKRYLRLPSILFLGLLVVAAAVSVARYGNPVMAGIGALSYLAPLPAVLLGYHFALRTGRAGVERWLLWYLMGAVIVLSSIMLEYAGVEWTSLGQVGVGFELYQDDAILTAHSGFFRASETAAWHTATAVCVLLLLASMRKLSTRQVVVAVAVVAGLLVVGILTGRRKIFVEIAIFVCGFIALLVFLGKGGLRTALAVSLCGLLGYGAVLWWVQEQPYDLAAAGAAPYRYYAERSATVAGDVTGRFLEMGLIPMQWAVEDFGWLGGGLGVASQGAQHFGGGGEIFGGAGEGGLGKVTAELGIPGLLVALWLGVAAIRLGWRVLVFVSARSGAVARLAYGLAAFLIANLAAFFVATQVFGDLFVLLILGLVTGFFLATPTLADRERAPGVRRESVRLRVAARGAPSLARRESPH